MLIVFDYLGKLDVEDSYLSATNRANVGIDVNWSPAMGVVSIELDAISISIIPLLGDYSLLPCADVGLDCGADLEA
jgi:hypothetical protein